MELIVSLAEGIQLAEGPDAVSIRAIVPHPRVALLAEVRQIVVPAGGSRLSPDGLARENGVRGRLGHVRARAVARDLGVAHGGGTEGDQGGGGEQGSSGGDPAGDGIHVNLLVRVSF
jgi:hypothetical protein